MLFAEGTHVAIALVMILSFAMFFVAVSAEAGFFGKSFLGTRSGAGADDEMFQSVTKSVKGTWNGIGYNVGQGICAAGLLQTMALGKGVMTLTGKSEWFSVGCLDPATGVTEGTAVITAANGDLVYLTFHLQLIPDTLGADFGTWVQTTEMIGGTGRFENASGPGDSSGTYKFIGAIDAWSGTNEGWITFY